MNHTKGPWIDNGLIVYAADAADDVVIADCDFGSRLPEINEANARLIASAPDLLHALRECRDHGFHSVEHLVLAAIAKAESGQGARPRDAAGNNKTDLDAMQEDT